MKIKNLFMIGLAALLAGVLTTGCKTTSTVTVHPDGSSTTNTVTHFDATSTVKVMHQIIPPAVKYADQATPQYQQYIVDAQVAACSLVGSTNVTPDALKSVMESTGINGIKTPEIEGVVTSVYGIYSAFYDDLVTAHLPQNQIVDSMTVLLQGLCDSLTEGLNSSPPVVISDPAPAVTVTNSTTP